MRYTSCLGFQSQCWLEYLTLDEASTKSALPSLTNSTSGICSLANCTIFRSSKLITAQYARFLSRSSVTFCCDCSFESCQCHTSTFTISSGSRVVSCKIGLGLVPKNSLLPFLANIGVASPLTSQLGVAGCLSASAKIVVAVSPDFQYINLGNRMGVLALVSKSATQASCAPLSSNVNFLNLCFGCADWINCVCWVVVSKTYNPALAESLPVVENAKRSPFLLTS